PEFAERFLRPGALERMDEKRKQVAQIDLPSIQDDVAGQQRELDELAQAAIDSADKSVMRRFSLVPARGLLQAGWLTCMFLHFGWLHLLGNLLFFYLVGP